MFLISMDAPLDLEIMDLPKIGLTPPRPALMPSIELTTREAESVRDALLSSLAHLPGHLHNEALLAYRLMDYVLYESTHCPCDSIGQECTICTAVAKNREAQEGN